MPIRMGQYGAGHGHAAGKARAMLGNVDVELVGVYEPDPTLRGTARESWGLPGIRWLESADQILGDPTVAAVAIEGRNAESLAMAQGAAAAGKHLWYDKPAGDDWAGYLAFADEIQRRGLYLQMGYMFRYHDGFRLIAEWARSGLLGDLFGVRAHMSTRISVSTPRGRESPAFSGTREAIGQHRGGIFYDLGGHVLDQVVWLMGRPRRVTSFFRNDATPELPAFADNTVCILEFDRGLGIVDIAAMESRPVVGRDPAARRFEVYGTKGSAFLEPFEPASEVRLHLDEATGSYAQGVSAVPIATRTRQQLYERELSAFLAVVRGEREPVRPFEHEYLVQETLLRATGAVPETRQDHLPT